MIPAEQLSRLQQVLRAEAGWVIAFSGGVDSSVLLAAASETVGKDCVLAVIADSASLARRELASAQRTAAALGVAVELLQTEEMEDPRYRANAGDRCFWCKEALFVGAQKLATARGWALAYGEQADDHGDHRPGAQSAALRKVRAPLAEAGWSKDDIREYARDRGLDVAEKLSSPCLASRVAVGQAVSPQVLAQIEAVEAAAHDLGLALVRARHLGDGQLRLECGEEEWPRAQKLLPQLQALAQQHGYAEFRLGHYQRGSVATIEADRLDV